MAEDDDSSCDTETAFLDMIGGSADAFANFDKECLIADSNEESDNSNNNITIPKALDHDISYDVQSLHPLPLNCSRETTLIQEKQCAFTVRNFLSDEECQYLIGKANSTGFHYITEAKHKADDGTVSIIKLLKPNTHKLSLFEDSHMERVIWNRLKQILIQHMDASIYLDRYGMPKGINHRLRVLKYDAVDNDVFDPHYDVTTFDEQLNLQSQITVLLYLNEECEGGETHFINYLSPDLHPVKVVPTRGGATIFDHGLYHSGAKLSTGTKYILRTDVMFHKCQNNTIHNIINKEEEEGREKCAELLLTVESCLYDGNTCLSNKSSIASLLKEAGMLHTTLDCFCSPGLVVMRRVMDDMCRNSNPEVKESMKVFVDSAFNALSHQR